MVPGAGLPRVHGLLPAPADAARGGLPPAGAGLALARLGLPADPHLHQRPAQPTVVWVHGYVTHLTLLQQYACFGHQHITNIVTVLSREHTNLGMESPTGLIEGSGKGCVHLSKTTR